MVIPTSSSPNPSPRPSPARRQNTALSAHSMHTLHDEEGTLADADAAGSSGFDALRGASMESERSDASHEEAGLVSRMSSESDRAARRARYEGKGGLRGISAARHSASRNAAAAYATDDEDDDQATLDEERQHRNRGAGARAASRGDSHSRHSTGGSGYDWESESQLARDREQHFDDRRETGGWSARLKGRGVCMRAWEIAREVSRSGAAFLLSAADNAALFQALPTLTLALFSLMFAGELLVHIARWPVFVKVDKLFILIPILLNLKGNLEMNLSLRMSTSANIGELDVRRTRETLIFGNLALLQVQALIVSAFAGMLSFVLGVLTPAAEAPATVPSIPGGKDGATSPQTLGLRLLYGVLTRRGGASTSGGRLSARRIIHHHPKPPSDPALKLRNGYFEWVLVVATSMLSASLSSAILGSFMCALVVVARRMGGNPDNIASPLAASLGDLLTLTLLGLLASVLVHFEGTILATLILAGLIVACGTCFVVAYRNAYVRELLSSGWFPLIAAMFISSGAGLLLDAFVLQFEGFALLGPVCTGLPGACAAIYVSRTTTALHSGKGAAANLSPPRRPYLSASEARRKNSLWNKLRARAKAIPGPCEGWLVPITLFCIGTTIESVYLAFVWSSGQMSFGWPFALGFVCIGSCGIALALTIAHCVTLGLWAYDYDPDIYSLPFVTATYDVVGQGLLVLTFTLALWAGDHITAAVNAGEGHGGM